LAVIQGTLFFAPGIKMAEINFDDHQALIDAFEKRVKGLFIQPVFCLREIPGKEGALFASALLIAALVESLARVEGLDEERKPIAAWLTRHVPEFARELDFQGRKTAADVFEERFRNGLAHSGYVASLGRLSDEINVPVLIADGIVTVNPFRLIEAVESAFDRFLGELRDGRRDRRRFSYDLSEQFQEEVTRAQREEAAAWN
jgi:hypothetical protein